VTETNDPLLKPQREDRSFRQQAVGALGLASQDSPLLCLPLGKQNCFLWHLYALHYNWDVISTCSFACRYTCHVQEMLHVP